MSELFCKTQLGRVKLKTSNKNYFTGRMYFEKNYQLWCVSRGSELNEEQIN